MIHKVPPVVAKPTPEGAVFAFTWLSFTGTGMLIAAIISGLVMGFSPVQAGRSLRRARSGLRLLADHHLGDAGDRHADPLLGLDATLGLAFAGTGRALPVLRHAARLARRRADRLGHRVERAVRQPAEDHRRSSSA